MTYNIDFEIAASIFLVLLLIFHRVQYNTNSKRNRYFRILLFAVLLANLSDIISCYTITFTANVPLFLNYVINMIYYVCTAVTTYIFLIYTNTYFEKHPLSQKLQVFNISFFLFYVALIVTTPFTRFLFYFDEERTYLHGKGFLVLYIVAVYFLLVSITTLCRRRNILTRKLFYTLFSYLIIALFSTILQYTVFGNMLVAYFAAAVAAMILLFTLETPDYQKLVATMELAETQKQEAIKARLHAEKADKAKSTFLANMSHEIRTPLNGILGMDEVAIQECNDPVITEYLTDIKEAGENLLLIINDILDFSKIESGKMEIQELPYQFSSIIKSAKSLLVTRAGEKNLDLQFEIDSSIPEHLIGDEIRIRQIIINLLTNAIKYTPSGFVKLKASYESLDSENVMLSIEVSDSGIGITKENQEKLFSAFQRFDLEQNRSIEGTGLGLRITKQLTDLMHGTIFCESEYGKGSTFHFAVPQKLDHSAVLESANSIESQSFGDFSAPDLKILVVDDVKVNLKVILGLLKPTKVRIETAESGKECLELCKDQAFDAIFLDHMMPEMDGVETLNLLKEMPEFRKNPCPVIALTANAIVGAREEFISYGFDDYLAKPVKKEELYGMIQSFVNNG